MVVDRWLELGGMLCGDAACFGQNLGYRDRIRRVGERRLALLVGRGAQGSLVKWSGNSGCLSPHAMTAQISYATAPFGGT